MTRDDGYTRYTVRIPTPLYERVKAAAGEKSVNAEIVAALEEKYPAPLPFADREFLRSLVGLADYILGTEDRDAQQVRLHEVNERLRTDATWKGWKLVIAPALVPKPGREFAVMVAQTGD